MKKLLIVESPAKIKTISKFLDKEFKIMSTMGHIMDLPTKHVGVTMNDSIEIEYVPLDKKEKTIAELCKAAQKAEEIYLAPDPDREGEIIAWHTAGEILKVVNPKKVKIYRIAFNEITKPAILDAVNNPGNIDLQKVAAQQARRVLDRWVGYEVSPVLWKKFAPGLSAGRVQSVALRLICEREDEIRNFKPEEYWSIHGLFTYQTDQLEAALVTIGKEKVDIKTKENASSIVNGIKQQSYKVESVTDKKRSKSPLAPFMTSTLQQAAFNQLGFTVKKTMTVAQQLYEGIPLSDPTTPIALITYMRTDSLRISNTALEQARDYISTSFNSEYLPTKPQLYAKSKAATQDAHEAIRPVDLKITPERAYAHLPKDAARLYELIWKRFVACQMSPAQYAQRQVTISGGPYTFKATGSTLLFDGFLAVYHDAQDEEKDQKVIIPASFTAKKQVNLQKVTPKQHFTQAPPKYTEGSLVKELEKEGIGRPSTYATILSTIQARSYTTLDSKKRFTPTDLGMAVTRLLSESLPGIMAVKFTAHMEEDLDKVASGTLARDKLLKEFYKAFEKELSALKGADSKKVSEPTTIECPACHKSNLVIRFGKTGEFLGCPTYPACTFTAKFTRAEDGTIIISAPEEPKLLEETCPLCGKPLRVVSGRFGQFIACSGYPDCTYIKQTKAEVQCPLDGGDLVKRKWRGGSFWGCSNYPKCNFAVFGEIEQQPCPVCHRPFLAKKTEKNGDITLTCTNKECGYKKVVTES